MIKMNWIERRLYKRYLAGKKKKWLRLYQMIMFGPFIAWVISGTFAVFTKNVQVWFIMTLTVMLGIAFIIMVHLTYLIYNDKKKDWERRSKYDNQ